MDAFLYVEIAYVYISGTRDKICSMLRLLEKAHANNIRLP